MSATTAEFIGTALLILLGVGVNANTSLKNTYGNGSGWVVVSFGWGFAVFIGVLVAGPVSGAHINPAVTIGLAVANKFPWAEVPGYLIAQMGGAMLGAFLVWVFYAQHYNATEDPGTKLGTFCTGPAMKNTPQNLFSEVLGAFVLVFVVLYIAGPTIEAGNLDAPAIGLGSIGALPVALLVVAIGMSLGGTTGYAINSARDMGPRIIHALVPIKGKGPSNWGYSWIPFFGPIIGGVLAAWIYTLLQ